MPFFSANKSNGAGLGFLPKKVTVFGRSDPPYLGYDYTFTTEYEHRDGKIIVIHTAAIYGLGWIGPHTSEIDPLFLEEPLAQIFSSTKEELEKAIEEKKIPDYDLINIRLEE